MNFQNVAPYFEFLNLINFVNFRQYTVMDAEFQYTDD
jgi:hypothetical protein